VISRQPVRIALPSIGENEIERRREKGTAPKKDGQTDH
jgi:DUF1009 family protein